MATFTGTGGNDVANATSGTLTGFSGGSVAELQDGTGDLFNGANGNDTIIAGAGADTINGGAGDDLLGGGLGADSLDGGSGFDFVSYESAAGGVFVNLATGTASGGDVLVINTIEGVRGSGFADTLTGSNRTDDSEQFQGLAGNDTINGQGGFDEVRYDRDAGAGGAGAVTVNLSTGFATDGFGNTDTLQNIEGARGTALADTFIGNGQNNQFTGLDGNDTFTGGGGFDELRYDRDSAFGGNAAITATFTAAGIGTVVDGFGATDSFSGIQAMRGTAFADTFTGFSGGAKEEFFGLAGNDTLNGGLYGNFDFARYDRDSAYGGNGSITLNFGTGIATDGFGNTDTLINIYGVWGGIAGDTLTGDNRNNGFIGGGGGDTINGGDGFDTLFYLNENNNVAVNVNLATGVATDTFGATDTVSNIEEVQTGNLNDTIIGGNVSESFSGGGGNDSINGGGGFDFMRGGSGNDTLNGFAGVGIHADQSSGDADTAAYDDFGATQGVNVNLDAGTATDGFGNTDTLIDIERVRGTGFADTMLGSSTQNLRQERFEGLGGADTINGQAGFDVVRYDRDSSYGGNAGVTVNLAAGTATDGFGATDTLISIEGVFGTAQADSITGNADNNNFRPFAGADTIDGGGGLDTIQLYYNDNQIGGAGASINMALGIGVQVAGGGTFTFTSIEAVDGSTRNDTIIGGTGADNLSGDLGNDSIDGGDGDDTINGGAGVDTLIGGAGSDWIGYVFDTTEPAINALDAGQNANFGWLAQNWNWTGVTVNLATGAMSGLDGAVDTFSGFENVFGTYLNDSLTGDAGDNRFRGYSGNDTIDGGIGFDTVVYTKTVARTSGIVLAGMVGDNPLNINVNLAGGTAQDGNGGTDTLIGIEGVVGGEGNDVITGSSVTNILAGGLGNDTLFGGASNDTLDGGAGVDTADYSSITTAMTIDLSLVTASVGYVSGDASVGNDQLDNFENILAGSAGDYLYGNNAANVINAGAGNDYVVAWYGNDSIIAGDGFDLVDASYDNDTVDGGADNDTIYGGSGNDSLVGGEGNDDLYGQLGVDTLIGGNGNDLLFADESDAVVVGGAGNDFLILGGATAGTNLSIGAASIENVFGSNFGDTINGAGSNDAMIMLGYDGNDALTGGNLADYLLGYNGADTLTGGNGNDVLYGMAGADQLFGGAGTDVLYVDAADTIVLGGADTDYLVWDDVVGANLNIGASEIEWATGRAQNDVINAAGAANFIEIRGDDGADTITGGNGGSILIGGNGTDRQRGGSGTDHHVGGAGADVFVTGASGGTDYVYDFVIGTDKVEMNAIPGVTAFANLTVNTAYSGSGWYGYSYGSGTIWVNTTAIGGGQPGAGDFLFA